MQMEILEWGHSSERLDNGPSQACCSMVLHYVALIFAARTEFGIAFVVRVQ